MSNLWKILAAVAVALLVSEVADSFVLDARDPRISQYDARLGWKLKPGLSVSRRGREGAWDVYSNADGIRTDRARAPLGCADTVVVGDSLVFGQGVNIEQRFDRALNAQKTLNFGFMGYGASQYFLYADDYLKAHACPRPRQLIVLVEKNDWADAVYPTMSWRYRPLITATGEVEFPGGPWNAVHGYLRDHSYLYYAWLKALAKQPAPTAKPTYSKLFFDLSVGDRLIMAQKTQFVFDGFPDRFEYYPEYLEFCKTHRCLMLGLSPQKNPDLYLPNDAHWNGRGNLEVAKRINPAIAD